MIVNRKKSVLILAQLQRELISKLIKLKIFGMNFTNNKSVV